MGRRWRAQSPTNSDPTTHTAPLCVPKSDPLIQTRTSDITNSSMPPVQQASAQNISSVSLPLPAGRPATQAVSRTIPILLHSVNTRLLPALWQGRKGNSRGSLVSSRHRGIGRGLPQETGAHSCRGQEVLGEGTGEAGIGGQGVGARRSRGRRVGLLLCRGGGGGRGRRLLGGALRRLLLLPLQELAHDLLGGLEKGAGGGRGWGRRG